MRRAQTTLKYDGKGAVRVTRTRDGRSVLFDDVGRCYRVYHGGVSGFTQDISKSDGWAKTLRWVRARVRDGSWPVGDQRPEPIPTPQCLHDVFHNLKRGEYGRWRTSEPLSFWAVPDDAAIKHFGEWSNDTPETEREKVASALDFFTTADPRGKIVYGYHGDCGSYSRGFQITVFTHGR